MVTTEMPVALSALASPVTRPVNVTVTNTPPNTCPVPDIVITNDVDEGGAAVPSTFMELMKTPGAGPRTKKFDGKKRVILSPDARVPPPLGRNEKVAALLGCCATLSVVSMEKLGRKTRLPQEG